MGHNYLEQNILENYFLVPKCTRVQLFRTKNSGKQLFRGKIYWGTAIQSKKMVVNSYLEAKYTGSQLFRGKNTATQLFR